MLAVKVVLGEVDEVDTLVFDEVDAGVGARPPSPWPTCWPTSRARTR